MAELLTVGLLVAFLVPARAIAQDDDRAVTDARAHFEAGEGHYDAGRYALAAQEFQQAHDLLRAAHHPNAALVLFNVGRSLMEVGGHDQQARDAYARFLAETPVSANTTEMIALGQQHVRELDARLATARSTTPTASPGSDATRTEGGISPIGPILLGVGGAMLVVGAVTGGLALAADSDLTSTCGPDSVCPESERSRVSDLQTLGITTDVLLFGGLAVAAVGLVLLLVLRDGPSDSRAQLRPSCGPSECTMRLTF